MRYNTLQATVYFIFCMMCIASCSSVSYDDPGIDNGIAMTFDVTVETRAITTDIDEFSIYGDCKLQSESGDASVIFSKTPVRKNAGVWQYDDSRYWIPNREHSFVAVNPSSVLERQDAAPQYSASGLSFTYTMPTYTGKEMQGKQDKSELIDIVAATHRRIYNGEDNANAITFSFSHLLSMVNFKPMLNDNSIKAGAHLLFHKFELIGFSNKVKYTITPKPLPAGTSTDDLDIDVTCSGSDNLTIAFTEPIKVDNGKQISLFEEGDAIMVLPQNFEGQSSAKVRFTYAFSDAPDIKREGEISLKGMKWEPGKSYTYNFTLDKIGLHLGTATIENWTSTEITESWDVNE